MPFVHEEPNQTTGSGEVAEAQSFLKRQLYGPNSSYFSNVQRMSPKIQSSFKDDLLLGSA
jgi:hypothetical protein